MTREHIEMIKSEISKVIGPIGKFMVEKQVSVMGHTEDDFPEEELPELIDRVVDIGVYDSKMARSIKQKIKAMTGVE